ncbi:MAG: type II toxin-antitoxin system RelE/ParE family toxin [Planctomycetales bacterium]|nr:type II toxin-antitoxin system RelE/ParE family toxin [Planctomycetales bacterium]
MAISSFRHKGLKELFIKGTTRHIGKRYHATLLMLLDVLDAIDSLDDCHGVRGFHPLLGKRSGSYSMIVSGNYRLTFGYDGEDVIDLDFEDYQ